MQAILFRLARKLQNRMLAPGSGIVELGGRRGKRPGPRPQLADLESLRLTAQTVQGPLHFAAQGKLGDRELRLEVAAGCQAELVLPREEKVAMNEAPGRPEAGLCRYLLGEKLGLTLRLRHV